MIRSFLKIQWGINTHLIETEFKTGVNSGPGSLISTFDKLSQDFVIYYIKTIRLMEKAAVFARNLLVPIPILQEIHSPISSRNLFLISEPILTSPRFKAVVSEKFITTSSIDFGTTSGL